VNFKMFTGKNTK